MSRVRDRWHNRDRTRTSRYGKGKRWLAIRTDGAGRETTRAFTTKDAATAWAHSTDDDHPKGSVTVAEWAETWQARQVHQRQTSRDSVRYKVNAQIVPTLGARKVADLTRSDIQDAVLDWQEHGLAPSTTRIVYGHLSSMLREAVLDGLIPASPCVGIRLPRDHEKSLEVLTVEQVQVIADAITPWMRDAVLLAAATGMRPGEWRGLTADRVDLRSGVVRVDRQANALGPGWVPPKTASSKRVITVGPSTVEVLERLVAGAAPTGHLFHTDGVPWKRWTASDAWSRCRKAGREWMGSGPHQLRHHHASFLLSRGASPVAVARRLGHKDATETLQTYAHVMPSDDAVLAALADGLVR